MRTIGLNALAVEALRAQRTRQAGEELAVISKVLGHADYSTTLEAYAHLGPKRAKAAAGRIDAALGRQPAAVGRIDAALGRQPAAVETAV